MELPMVPDDFKASRVLERLSSISDPDHASDLPDNSPTKHEIDSLRRVAASMSPKVYVIAIVEICERLSSYGTFAVFPLPPGSTTGAPLDPHAPDAQPGALGRGQEAMRGLTTFNSFWQYFTPLLGAYLADQYWGRYKTISITTVVYLIGHVIIIFCAIPSVIDKPDSSLAVLVIGLLVLGLGFGGFKPNINLIVVEQLDVDYMKVTTLKSGERVVIDPAMTIERVYMWFFFLLMIGAVVGQISMAYAERYVGFWLSFLLPTAVFALCPAILLLCRRNYRDNVPAGSVLPLALRTFVYAQCGRWSPNPFRTWRNMHDGTFWDRVKPSAFTVDTRPSWMTFDDAWVDELSRGFSACAVSCYLPFYWLCFSQLSNNLAAQAAVLSKHGLPNDVLSNLDPIALLILIPLCDQLLFPALRRFNIRLTPIKKIALGFYLGALAMVWACVLQLYIYRLSPCGYGAGGVWTNSASGRVEKCPVAPINVWAQTGAYVLIALSEIFTAIPSLEYAYSKAPRNMRSMVQAFSMFMIAFSAAIGQAWTPLSKDPLLLWNYGSIAVIATIAGTAFWLQFHHLDQQEDALNQLPPGTVYNRSPYRDEDRTLDVAGTHNDVI